MANREEKKKKPTSHARTLKYQIEVKGAKAKKTYKIKANIVDMNNEHRNSFSIEFYTTRWMYTKLVRLLTQPTIVWILCILFLTPAVRPLIARINVYGVFILLHFFLLLLLSLGTRNENLITAYALVCIPISNVWLHFTNASIVCK